MRGSWLGFVVLLLLSRGLAAQEEDISSLLDEVSEIATKTKLNIDYQPSVVSVLHADKLKKIGIRNVHEALGLLPGIETSMLHTGWKQVIIRGVHNPDTFVFDKYKLYIDGVDIGSDLYSTSYYYLDFPVELIDRIEVLRGSASTIYGPGAFSGAINVITKSSLHSDDDKIFASIGSFGYGKGGFVKHILNGEWKIGVDGYYQANNKTLDAGEEYVSSKEAAYLRSDYNSLENFKDFSIGVNAQKNGWKWIGRFKSETTDNFYGLSEDIEPVSGGYQKNQSAILEIQNQYPLQNSVDLETKLGINYYQLTFDSTIYQDYLGSGIPVHMNPTYEQLNTYADIALKGKNFLNHQWMAGIGVNKINTIKNLFGTTTRDQDTGGPTFYGSDVVYLDGQYGWLAGDNDQWIKSVYVQDIIALSDQLDISLNIRYDDYQLFDSMLSYRLGSVYRINENHILKGTYGRSYRAPAYVEAFQAPQDGFKNGNPTLKPEQIDTYEMAYTYKNVNTTLRSNVFYSILKNVIDRVENEPTGFTYDYLNHKERNARGVELEYTYRFGNGAEWMSNFSYARIQYFSPDYFNPIEYQSPEVSEILSKGYFLFPFGHNINLNTSWYYSGPKKGYLREDNGKSKAYPASMIVDETVVYEIDGDSTVTLSVKNLFNESVIYPSYDLKHDGLHREGRNWLMTYEKRF